MRSESWTNDGEPCCSECGSIGMCVHGMPLAWKTGDPVYTETMPDTLFLMPDNTTITAATGRMLADKPVTPPNLRDWAKSLDAAWVETGEYGYLDALVEVHGQQIARERAWDVEPVSVATRNTVTRAKLVVPVETEEVEKMQAAQEVAKATTIHAPAVWNRVLAAVLAGISAAALGLGIAFHDKHWFIWLVILIAWIFLHDDDDEEKPS